MKYIARVLLGSVLVASSSLALAEGTGTYPQLRSEAEVPVISTRPASPLDDIGRDVRVIDHANRRVCIAIIEASPMRARGWYILANGEERTFYNISHIHAEECGQTGVSWNPPWDLRSFCLQPTAAFDYYTPDNANMCAQLGGVMSDYYRVPYGAGVYEWTLYF